MVIAGKIRGNASQLANYLLAEGTNERIHIMDVDGQSDADADYLKDMLYSMELNSELTRSRNSVYHAYINPNPEDTIDRAISMDEWQQSVDILTKQLGYEDQRKVVVLHEKSGHRVHAHIVYERYNHDRGTTATYEHNYNAHDKARAEMEKVLNHKPTPNKNKNRDHYKQTLTQIWQLTQNAQEFICEAEKNGYKIAKGTDRPFRVIDAEGVSFDLARKLEGIKTKELRSRFAGIELPPEKEAIQQQQAAKQKNQTVTPPEKPEVKPEPLQPLKPEPVKPDPVKETTAAPETPQLTPIDEREELRRKFLDRAKEVRQQARSNIRDITLYILIALKVSFSFKGHIPKDIIPERISMLTEQFYKNAGDLIAVEPPLRIENTIPYRKAMQTYKPN